MERFEVIQIPDLLDLDYDHLLEESKAEGFRFLERLVDDYKSGTNRFDEPGESLHGVLNEQGLLIAIGGLNRDPHLQDQKAGRLRRFYVAKSYRRTGIGRRLLNQIMQEARRHFTVLVLHTDTEQADRFYRSVGFAKVDTVPNSTHSVQLR